MKILLKSLCVYLVSTAASFAITITFDDLANGSIPAGYGGLQWSGFNTINATTQPQSGYQNGVVSLNNVATDIDGRLATLSSASAFNLSSAYLTAAWSDGLQLEVEGFVGSTLAYNTTYTLNTTGPSLLAFNFVGVDKVEFIPSGGTLHPGYANHGIDNTDFAMDNLTINIPDTGATSVLMVAACGGLAMMRRKFGVEKPLSHQLRNPQ